MRPRITIIGGGSVQWAPKLVVDILMNPDLAGASLTIHDIDTGAAHLIGNYAIKAAKKLDVDATIIVEDDLDRALTGADYVIITISTGGLDAMGLDISIPEEFGIFHTVGDSTGPAGWSRLIRNYSIFTRIATRLKALAPEAVVLNYTNPMTTLTGVLATHCENLLVGLCHGLFYNITFMERLYGVSEQEISIRYAGLNHLYWMTDVKIGRNDVLQDLHDRISGGESLTTIEATLPVPTGGEVFHSNHELANELFLTTGALPYMADRHTCEFVPWGITNRERMGQYKLERTTMQMRQRERNTWRREVESAVHNDFADGELSPTREAASRIIGAHLVNRPFVDVGNLVNRGQVRNLPLGVVVETAVAFDRNGFTPLAFGSLPPLAAALSEAPARAYEMALQACISGDKGLALQALRLEPTTYNLRSDEVFEMGARLLDANKAFDLPF